MGGETRLERPAPAGAGTEGQNGSGAPASAAPRVAGDREGPRRERRLLPRPGRGSNKTPPRPARRPQAGPPGSAPCPRSLPNGPDPARGWVPSTSGGGIERDRRSRRPGKRPSFKSGDEVPIPLSIRLHILSANAWAHSPTRRAGQQIMEGPSRAGAAWTQPRFRGNVRCERHGTIKLHAK